MIPNKIKCKTKFSKQNVFIYKIWTYRKLVLTLNYCWNFNRRRKKMWTLFICNINKCILCTKCIILKIYHELCFFSTQNNFFPQKKLNRFLLWISLNLLLISLYLVFFVLLHFKICVCMHWKLGLGLNLLFTCWEHGW